jgi:hypothetical protein
VQAGEDTPVRAEVGVPHVRVLDGAVEGQGELAKLIGCHQHLHLPAGKRNAWSRHSGFSPVSSSIRLRVAMTTAIDRLLQRRLRHQQLLTPVLRDPAAVVSSLGAMQAQEFAPARWAVGLRAKGARDGDVARAFDAGAILRTHVMRPTWHFVAPEDIRWLLALTAPRVRAATAYHDRLHGIDARRIARAQALIERELEGGPLTRAELAVTLDAADARRARRPDLQRAETRPAVHLRAARGACARGASPLDP